MRSLQMAHRRRRLDLYRAEPTPIQPADLTAMLSVADIVTMVLLPAAAIRRRHRRDEP